MDIAKTATSREAADKTKKALGLLERMQRRFPQQKHKVKSGFIESQLYACQGKETLAKSVLEKAESEYGILEPKDIDARLDYSCAHIMSGDKQKAYKELHLLSKEQKDIEAVQQRIDRISEEPISLAGKTCAAELSKSGINAYQGKRFDEAIKVFGDALKMFPNHVGVNLNLVQTILAKTEVSGQTNEAYIRCQECFKKVGQLDKEHKQYTRLEFLEKQFSEVYKNYQLTSQ